MYQRKLTTAVAVSSLLMMTFIHNVSGAEEGSVQGRVWYQSTEDAEWAMEMEIIDGISVPRENQYAKQVRVLLLGEPLDHEKFLAAMAKTNHTLLALGELGIEKSVTFDICSDNDGSNVEVCYIAIQGPGLSFSESGFSVYSHFTESVSFENGRVAAKLKTEKPEEKPGVTFGFDLSFDLPIFDYQSQ